jgi:hypothetical protein
VGVKKEPDVISRIFPYSSKSEGDTMATAATAPDSDIKIKIGKMIFYITAATGLWFFYWFAGIQCPC